MILDTIKKYLRIDRREICFLKFILEAYDGIASLTTVNPDLGVVRLHIPPGCAEDVKIILQDLKKNFIIEDASAETSENR
ncbi:MAG: DUF4911 domain-containing protein [Deltaproteobacteria bacterium]|nr:DUF4911 domain-containing protein [Deltaproteobacteria bacterium]MBW2571263.1 DUF4911 domain-containing protein [Deltaproteobacteria bacterium]MBW2670698.1 DUF4911 domain-containing protein [Deltaproteobacteria bacterium]